MRPSFLTLGECMVELSDLGDGTYRRGFAGDAFNTAYYARQLLPENWGVSFGTVIGNDPVSKEMERFIAAQAIANDAIRTDVSRTVGLYMISLAEGERSFSYWRERSAARLLASDPIWLDQVVAGRAAIYFSGITLAILSPEGRDSLLESLTKVRSAGTQVFFDTNLRPRLWENTEAMRAGIAAGLSVADVALPSFDEDSVLWGDKTPEDLARRYAGSGAGTILVKNGANRITLLDHEGLRGLDLDPVEKVVDSTAAGDSFGAGVVATLVEGGTVETAVRRGAALAAKVIQTRGALVTASDLGERA